MIRSFTKALSLLVLCAATFSACKKDKDDDSLAVTKENLVGTYTVASIKWKVNGQEQDMTDYILDPCQKDDQTTLKADSTYEYKDAGTVCSPNGDDTGTWSTDGKKVTIDGDANTVKSFTKSTLVFEETGTENGVTYTQTTTLSKK